MHPAKKRTNDRRDGKRDALATAARREEKKWVAACPAAVDLPPDEIRPSRAERRGRLEVQLLQGDEPAKRAADEIRRRERDDAAERERVRNRRHRPQKHLPKGLVEFTTVIRRSQRVSRDGTPVCESCEEPVSSAATRAEFWRAPGGRCASCGISIGVLFAERRDFQMAAEKGDPGAKTTLAVRRFLKSGGDDYERVSPELHASAQVLLRNFVVDVHDASMGIGSHLERTLVRREVAKAIRAGIQELSRIWIPLALDLVALGLVEVHRQLRGAALPSGPPWGPKTSAPEIHAALVRQLRRHGLLLADNVTVSVIAWMLEHLAVGTARGGGRTGRMSGAKMREILADPKRLDAAMRDRPVLARK